MIHRVSKEHLRLISNIFGRLPQAASQHEWEACQAMERFIDDALLNEEASLEVME